LQTGEDAGFTAFSPRDSVLQILNIVEKENGIKCPALKKDIEGRGGK